MHRRPVRRRALDRAQRREMAVGGVDRRAARPSSTASCGRMRSRSARTRRAGGARPTARWPPRRRTAPPPRRRHVHAALRALARRSATSESSLRSTGPSSPPANCAARCFGRLRRRSTTRRSDAAHCTPNDVSAPQQAPWRRRDAERCRPRARRSDRVGDHRGVGRPGAEASHAGEASVVELQQVGAIVVRDERVRPLSREDRPQRERRRRPRTSRRAR